MTSLVHVGQPTQQHSGVARFAGAVASLGAVFTHWAAVRREMATISRSGNLSVRAKRLMRSSK